MRNIFQKKQYLNCPHLQHTVHFFYDEIRSCCSNAKGITFETINDSFEFDNNIEKNIYNKRKHVVNSINSIFTDENYPQFCQGCSLKHDFISENKILPFENYINEIYIQNYMGCNAKCSYCTFEYCRNKEQLYDVYPIIKQMINKGVLSRSANIYISGGEPTLSKEFELLLTTLTEHVEPQVEVFTSGIKYSKSIENAFINDKVRLLISLDSGSSSVYKIIKKVDAFDKIIENLKKYISVSNNAKNNIILKYILLDGINDSTEEIFAFLNLVSSLKIKNVMFSFDYEKYKYSSDIQIPQTYFEIFEKFSQYAKELDLNVDVSCQADAIMRKYKPDF